MIISLDKVSLKYIERPILNEVDLVINEKEKWGVVGLNGAGKSTLLKILAQKLKADSGTVYQVPTMKISYCPQENEFNEELSVFDAVMSQLEQDEKVEEYEVKSILGKLGIFDLSMKIKVLSGGQKKRVALAKALIKPADLYLLDEPTNHLDQDMILWLEKFLIRMNKALILVTHDRYFLNRITEHMIEVEDGKLYTYQGNYADYLEQKQIRHQQRMASERKRQNFLRNEIEWIRRGAQARSTKSKERIARFEKINAIAAPKEKEKLTIDSISSRLGGKTIEIKHLSKSYGEKVCIQDFSYLLKKQDRIGIIGNNGCGKTTLLKMIVGEVKPDEGEIEIGETVKIGYFAQTVSHMDPNSRVIDVIKEYGEVIHTASGEEITASKMLERFLFTKEQQYTLVGRCSGGEKRRLYLLSILMQAPNILLLDEPTNDLDTETLTILEDYLENFNGAVVAVSHDRYFLDKIADHLFVLEDGKITQVTMDYSSYLEQKEKVSASKDKPTTTYVKKKTVKLSYAEKKELDELDQLLPKLEEKISMLEAQLNETSDYNEIKSISDELETLRNQQEEKTERWLILSEIGN